MSEDKKGGWEMDRDNNAAKSILTAGAATAICGLVLYAVGQTLSFLFRDVDPKRVGKEPAAEPIAEETEEAEQQA